MDYKDKFITRKMDLDKNCWVYWYHDEWRNLDQLFTYGKEIGICQCTKINLSSRLSSFFTGNENGIFQSIDDCFQGKIDRSKSKKPELKRNVTTDKPAKIEYLEMMAKMTPGSLASTVR